MVTFRTSGSSGNAASAQTRRSPAGDGRQQGEAGSSFGSDLISVVRTGSPRREAFSAAVRVVVARFRVSGETALSVGGRSLDGRARLRARESLHCRIRSVHISWPRAVSGSRRCPIASVAPDVCIETAPVTFALDGSSVLRAADEAVTVSGAAPVLPSSVRPNSNELVAEPRPRRGAATPVTIQEVEDPATFAALRPQWTELLRDSV